MNKITSLRFFLLLCLCHAIMIRDITAQEVKKNAIGLNFGASNFHVVDEHVSPLIFKGTGIAPALQYFRITPKNSHIVELDYYYDNLSSSSDNYNTENFRGRLRYAYLHNIFSDNFLKKPFQFYLGGSVTSFYCESDYYFYLQTFWARALNSWYWSHSLELAMLASYNLSDRDILRLQLYMPVISNVSRPGYSGSDDYNYETNEWEIKTFGETDFFPENLSANIHFAYERIVSAKISLQLDYEFFYARYDDPSVIKMYMNNFRFGLFYHF